MGGVLIEFMRHQDSVELQDQNECIVPLKNHELAELIAITPEHLSRVLKEMNEDRVIRRKKGLLYVTVSASLLQKTARPEIHHL